MLLLLLPTRKARLLLEETLENLLPKALLELTLEVNNLKDLALKESSLLEMKALSQAKALENLEEKKLVEKAPERAQERPEEKKLAEKLRAERALQRLKLKSKRLKTKE